MKPETISAKLQRSRMEELDNVNYQVRHCAKCAYAVDHNLVGTEQDCAKRGTFHGEVKKVYQETNLCRKLMKKGLLSPYFADRNPLLALFLGHYANEKEISNLITSAGKAGAASRLNGSGGEAAFTYIATGTGTNAANVSDTTLQTELAASGLTRANATASRVTTSVTNDTAQLVNTFSVSGTVAVTESGILNASSSGTLLARQVFTAINVVNGDSLQITWKVQCS